MAETLIKLSRRNFSVLKNDDILIVKDRIRNKQLVSGLSKFPCSQVTYVNDKCMLVGYTTNNSGIANNDWLIVHEIKKFAVAKPDKQKTILCEIDDTTEELSKYGMWVIDEVAILIDSSCQRRYYPFADLQAINVNLGVDLYKQE